MKPLKSIVVLAAGALALTACDMKKDTQTAAEKQNEETFVGGDTHSDIDRTGVGAGAGSDLSEDTTTTEGSGAISDEGIMDDQYDDDRYTEDTVNEPVIEEQEALPSTDAYESVDETSSEPDDVRGGRDARLTPKNRSIDNTSSESDDVD